MGTNPRRLVLAMSTIAMMVFGCEGPKGSTGAPGDQGPPGDPGAGGADGADGAEGPAGADGQDGDDGVPGDQGIPGDPAVDTGSIAGHVMDDAGQPVAGVTVETNPPSGAGDTDATGAFTISDVPIGVYTVIAHLAGYEDSLLPLVGVAAGGATNASLVMTPIAPTTGEVTGTVYMANGDAFPAAIVTAEGQAATAVTAADGTFTLSDVTPGFVFLHVEPPDAATFLPGETRHAVMVVAGETATGVEVTLSGRPSDAATYVGDSLCLGCHPDEAAAEAGSAHHRSLSIGQARMNHLNLFPAVGGTASTGVSNAKSPVDGVTNVTVYACQNSAGVYSFKFGGTADCTVADGTLIRIAGVYGGEGDHGIDNVPNLGRFKQRFFAALADVPLTAGWAYTAGKDLDYLTIPVQILESGDGASKFAGYHPGDWNVRGRTFSAACAGCHNTAIDLEWDASGFVTSFGYESLNITCENCHGPASEHLAARAGTRANNIVSLRNLTAAKEREACGMCHGADEGTSADPVGAFEYPYNAANANLVGGGIYVPGVYDMSDYLPGYDIDEEAGGGGVLNWPDGLHGLAHRQQAYQLERSVHTNNPFQRLACSDCHDTHSLQQGPRAMAAVQGDDTYELTNPTFKNNILCLSCHSSFGPYAGVSRQDVAIAFLNAGGAVSRNGAPLALGDFTAEEINEALMVVAENVGEHMEETVGMGVAAYNPLDATVPTGRCSSCHMPRTAKSGGWTTGLDAAGNSALIEGDQGSHVFDIIWPAQSAALRRANGGADTDIMPNSCGKCHAGSRLSGN